MIHFNFHSSDKRPDLRFRPTLTDRLLEGAAALTLIFTLLLLFVPEAGISESVTPDTRTKVLIDLLLVLLTVGCAYLPMRFMHFPVRITSDNAFRQLRLAVRAIRILSILLALLGLGTLLSCRHEAGKLVVLTVNCLIALSVTSYLLLALRNR